MPAAGDRSGKEVVAIVADLISAASPFAGKARPMRMLTIRPRPSRGPNGAARGDGGSMEVATESPSSRLLVPGVFGAWLRPHYDAFISRQRALTRPDGTQGSPSSDALREQMLDSTAVPMGALMSVWTDHHSDGPLAYTSEEDTAKAAKMMKSSGEQAASAAAVDVSDGAAEKEEEASPPRCRRSLSAARLRQVNTSTPAYVSARGLVVQAARSLSRYEAARVRITRTWRSRQWIRLRRWATL